MSISSPTLKTFWSVNPTPSNPSVELKEVVVETPRDKTTPSSSSASTRPESISPKPKSKKKENKDDDSDDELEASSKKKQPSKIKQATVVVTGTTAVLLCNFFKANPLVTIPLAALSASSCKSALRNIPRKIRYTILTVAVGLGFAVDYLVLPPNVTLNLGPTALVYLISVAGRTSKLWVLGKGAKDQ